MALDIFSYRAPSSSGGSQQRPMPLTKATVSPPNRVTESTHPDELKRTTWNQSDFRLPPKKDARQSLDPIRVSSDHQRIPTTSQSVDFDSSIRAVQEKKNRQSMHPESRPSLSNDALRFRCFDHDCGGRIFSCAENYRRHIREKEGSARILCTLCRVSFTRKSNLRKHVSERRCRVLKSCESHGKASNLGSSHVLL